MGDNLFKVLSTGKPSVNVCEKVHGSGESAWKWYWTGGLKDKRRNHWMNGIGEEAVGKFTPEQATTGHRRAASRWVKVNQKLHRDSSGDEAGRDWEPHVPWDAGCFPEVEKPLNGVRATGPGIVTGCLQKGHHHWQPSSLLSPRSLALGLFLALQRIPNKLTMGWTHYSHSIFNATDQLLLKLFLSLKEGCMPSGPFFFFFSKNGAKYSRWCLNTGVDKESKGELIGFT